MGDGVTLTKDEQKMEDDDRNSIELVAPGFGAKIRGAAWTSKELIVVIVVISCTGFLYFERLQSNKGFADQHTVTQAQNVVTQSMLASVLQGQAKLVREVSSGAEIQAYVMSLSQDKRERLNLSMPSELRQRIRTNSQ